MQQEVRPFDFLLNDWFVRVVAAGNHARPLASFAGAFDLPELRIFDASQFAALSGPSFLTQFAWRPDRILGQSGPRSVNLRIYASTTTRSVAGLSMTFADNLGADNTLVF